MLDIALPKGRLGDQVYRLFASIGCECPAMLGDDRRLVFESPDGAVRYLLVKPADVPIYVEHGAADVGVAGKDVLMECSPDVYELMDLGIGRCYLAVAAREGYIDDRGGVLRVATKYGNIARDYYASINRSVEVIHLNGSIELAPILGLADVILDIVESGATLRENRLAVVQTVAPISARLIANRSSFVFKGDAIARLTQKLAEVLPRD
ncbi:MAG: ATP phosphoribosyltransferase [Clostridiales bacterium]|nr:ATP phosphoribosyltransferase [Clostridiales bacterium]